MLNNKKLKKKYGEKDRFASSISQYLSFTIAGKNSGVWSLAKTAFSKRGPD